MRSPWPPRTLAFVAATATAAVVGLTPADAARPVSASAAASTPRTSGEVRSVVDPDKTGRHCVPDPITEVTASYDRTAGHRSAVARVDDQGAFVGELSGLTEATYDIDTSTRATITPRSRVDTIEVTGDTDYTLTVETEEDCTFRWVRTRGHNVTTIRVTRRTPVVLRWRTSPRYRYFSDIWVQNIRTEEFPLEADPGLDGRRGEVTGVLEPGRYQLESKFDFNGGFVDPGESKTWTGSYRYVLKKR